jgi:hypothetical protein
MNAANGASEASIAGRRAGLKVSRRPGACPTVKATFHKPWSDFRGRRPQTAYQNHQNRKKVLALQPQSKLESNCVRPVIHFGTKPQAMRQERVNTDAWEAT